ncbi:hypothetical protein BDV23DRAFT_183760 [Aspergillus alliaceus]|uniref:Uncharacterized protein n=1 Tax=Petromyces alliaceus TaxID=209559 RepID=A0A5N7C7T8_PETAA|nr:uncharacterized protein BDW43DRAFT_313536 [Aspergillus alliaceus]KAB8230967.1 hypothetical protein BDW43DRAFT_313536 [Aspergillus alliaceus]KAE8390059.1 hypothetical protein BDV23DRAFT_183760 [Aspergillus alliaceus]
MKTYTLITIFIILSSCFANASLIETRSVPAILKDFAVIGEKLIILDKAVKTYDPKLEDRMSIERKHANVEMAIIKAMNDVHATPPLKKKESSVVTNVAVKMQPVWVSYLHDIVVKRPEFEKAKLAGMIQEHIMDYKERCHKLAGSIEEKVTPEDRKTIMDRNQQLDLEFDRTIEAYD